MPSILIKISLSSDVFICFDILPFIYSRFVEMTVSELFFSDASLWNQYKFIAFNLLPCRSLIIFCKKYFTVISKETKTELTMYAILC